MSSKNLDLPAWEYPSPTAVHPDYYIDKAYAQVRVELFNCREVVDISPTTIATINRIFKLSGLCRMQSAMELCKKIERECKRVKVSVVVGMYKEIISIRCALKGLEELWKI